MKQERFRLHKGKIIFMITTARHWNRLPREVVDALSLETFEVRLDQALSSLTYL